MFSRVPFSMHLCSLWYSVLKVLPVILSRVWSFSLIQEVMWVPPGFPISAPQTGNSLKALACNVCDPISFFFFFCLLGITVLHSLLLSVLKTIVLYTFVFFVVISDERVILISDIPFWSEEEICFYHFIYFHIIVSYYNIFHKP